MNASAWAGLLVLLPVAAWPETFTVQIVKADRPGELVHVLDAETAKLRAEGGEGYPESAHGGHDRQGFRVTTWLKYVSIDGRRVFEKRYQGRFLFREASAQVDLDDGAHVLNPGRHSIDIRNGQASSRDTDIRIEGSTISLTCYPVQFCALNKSVDPLSPLADRMAHLPGTLFNVQVWSGEDQTGPDVPKDPKGIRWDDVLDVHTDFKPLTVYLPANTMQPAYRVLPSQDEFTLERGQVALLRPKRTASPDPDGDPAAPPPVEALASTGIFVEAPASVWIPRYTSRAIFRCKTPHPLYASLSNVFEIHAQGDGVAADTFEEQTTYDQFADLVGHEFLAGIPGLKPPQGLLIPSDFPAFPHRLLLADNRNPASNDARLLAAALERNVCRMGESLTARVQVLDLPQRDTLGSGEVRAFVQQRSPLTGKSEWLPVKTEPAGPKDLFRLNFSENIPGLYTLRLAVDRPGSVSPASDLFADFAVGLRAAAGKAHSLSLFTPYNREAFTEGEPFELVALVHSESPLSGVLTVQLQDDSGAVSKEWVRKEIPALPPGKHTFHFVIPAALTASLRPGIYRLDGSFNGCHTYGKTIRLVSRTRPSSLVIAHQPSWEGHINDAFKTDPGLDHLFEGLQAMGVNQLIETPGAGARHEPVPIQEEVLTGAASGLPAADHGYQPTLLEKVLDRALGAQMDVWLWRSRLVENLRWGPFEELDVDRGVVQFYALLGRRFPHVRGIDFGWWEAVEYVDMGSRSGSIPEHERVREQVLLPQRFKERYGLECPTQAELAEYTETGKDVNGVTDRWCKFYELKCELIPETFRLYREAVQEVNSDLLTTWTEQDVMVASPGAALIPEIAYRGTPISRWQSTHENGTRPLVTPLMTALGKYDDSARVSTIESHLHFHIPRVQQNHFRLWQRVLMSVACGADEIGYSFTDAYQPVRRMDMISPYGFITRNHLIEQIAVSSLNRALTLYSGILENARRERDLAILHSMTQLGFEHVYFGAEWHNNDPLCRYVDTPFHRGAHLLRVHSAFYALLSSHCPADIIGEKAILAGGLSRYKGLVLTGIELPLPSPVSTAIEAFIRNGGVVLMDQHCRTPVTGAVRLDFGFDFVRAGWSNRKEYRGMQFEYARVKDDLDRVLDTRFQKKIDCDSWTVLLSSLKWGDSRFLVAAGNRIVKDTFFQGAYEREPILANVILSGPPPVVYDLFEMKRLDLEAAEAGRWRFPADLTRVGARLYALLPAEVSAPELHASRSVGTGERLAVTVSIHTSEGQPINVLTPLEMTVLQPDGTIRYRVYRAIRGPQPLSEAFTIAENDPPGAWRAVARELFAGRASQVEFIVEAKDSQQTLAIEAAPVAVYGAERIRRFCASQKEVIVPYDAVPQTSAGRTETGCSLALAQRLQQSLNALGIHGELWPVQAFATWRQNIPSTDPNRAEKQVGPDLMFKGNVVIADIGGGSSLGRSLVQAGVIPVRVTPDFPGPGRGALLAIPSPFSFGYEALVVSGGDEAGFALALSALAQPAQLHDVASPHPPDVPARTEDLASSTPVAAEDLRSYPKGVTPGLNGMPVLHVVASPDGSRILAATENFMKNIFLLDEKGRILWSGKGAKKWPSRCRLTPGNEVMVADASGGVYHLDSQGKPVRRFPELLSADLSEDGQVLLAAGKDLTLGMKADGSVLWMEDYFPQRLTYGQLRSGEPRDDLVALSPNGQTGFVFNWGTETSGKSNLPVRWMRAVEMRSGRVLSRFEFKPHESLFDPYMRNLNMSVRFSRNGATVAVANMTGHLFLFSADGAQLLGSHFERGQILTAPLEKMGNSLSPFTSPTAWESRASPQFIDLRPDGSQVLAGFSNHRVVLLDRSCRVLNVLTFPGVVVSGAFLKQGFVIYAGGILHAYDASAKELWSRPLPVLYTLTALPDGNAVIGGSSGGFVTRIEADGTVAWTIDLHPESLGDVDELFRSLASAHEVACGPKSAAKTLLDDLASQVALSENLLLPLENPVAWTGTSWSVLPEDAGALQRLRLSGNGFAEQTITRDLQPLSTYFFSAWWKATDASDSLHVSATVREENTGDVTVEQTAQVGDPDGMELLLPIKTGPHPASLTVKLEAVARNTLEVTRMGIHRAWIDSPNVAGVPAAYTGITPEARKQAARSLIVQFSHLEGNLQEAVIPDPLEMLDGRIVRRGDSHWTAGDIGQMGGVQITFLRPQTIGLVAFYDDPAHPEAFMKQYQIEYWSEKPKPKEDQTEKHSEKKADEIEFTDEWSGEWKNLLVERDSKSPAHFHRLASPITSRQFRISGLLNRGLPPRDEDTRITEVELYETRWDTAGGSVRRTYFRANAGMEGPLKIVKSLLGGRRFTQSAPVYADGLLYLSSGGTLSAFSMDDLAQRWTFDVREETAIQATPTVTGDLVLLGGLDYELRALKASTGELVWTFATDFKITGSPCVLGERVFVGSGDGRLYALNLASGELLWSLEIGQTISSSVATDGEMVFFTSLNHRAYAVDPKMGKEKWSFETGDAVRSGVAVTDPAVFFGSDDGKVYAIEKTSGKPIWSHSTGGYIEASPAADGNTLYIGSVDGVFRALDMHNGALRWQVNAQSPVRCTALVLGNEVLFHADDGVLRMLNAQDGRELAQVRLPARGLTDITPMGNMLIVGTRSGYSFVTVGAEKK